MLVIFNPWYAKLLIDCSAIRTYFKLLIYCSVIRTYFKLVIDCSAIRTYFKLLINCSTIRTYFKWFQMRTLGILLKQNIISLNFFRTYLNLINFYILNKNDSTNPTLIDECEEIWTNSTTFKTGWVWLG